MIKEKAILKAYVDHIRKHAPYGVPETSHYGAMENLFDSVGKTLDPAIFCVINPSGKGAGIPDGGLFTEEQQGAEISINGFSVKPARGVIEAKPLDEDVHEVAKRLQVQKYLDAYGQVLVTNFYRFLLVRRGDDGSAVPAEFFSLADNEHAFLTAPEAQIVDQHVDDLFAFLQLVMLSAAPINRPIDVANVLAFYARDAKNRIERGDVDLSILQAVRADLENALGIKFEGKDGEHFFISTLVQTLFYGVFSAWVLWSESPESKKKDAHFDWRLSQYLLHIPVIQALIEDLTKQSRLKPMGLMPVLHWTGAALNRVDRSAFFEVFNTGQAVQYFYEPFLEAFDPQLRKDLGVWYTPPEIVQYMVERVDRVLREELDIDDGLADQSVYVLDPACGTGAYLVAVLEHIYRTKEKYYGREQAASAVRAAIRNFVGQEPAGRVFGFEILPAPFVVSHLQLGLLLQRLGAPLVSDEERVGVYLTNSLTGWQPGGKMTIRMHQLRQESTDADHIKQGRKILVVIGNPPYNAFAGTSTPAERIAETEGLVDRYKEGLRDKWGIKKYNLDDLYIRFFRIAERCIAEFRGEGVVCFISNYSWLKGRSFVAMREHLLSTFDRFWIENMHGDRTITEYAPDGRTSQTIFAIPGFSPGIKQGVAISTWVKNGKQYDPQVLFNDSLNAAKAVERRAQLLASLQVEDFDLQYEAAYPTPENFYSFFPLDISAEYQRWPLVTELCADRPINGLMEKRGGALIDIDCDLLEKRMRMYYDKKVSWEKLASLKTGLTKDAAGFDAKKVRHKLQNVESFSERQIVRYAVRPFDTRWCYYTDVAPLWNRARPVLWAQCWEGNSFFMTRPAAVADPEGVPVYFTTLLGDNDFQRGHSYYFPVQLRVESKVPVGQKDFLKQVDKGNAQVRANLSEKARSYLASLGITNPNSDAEAASMIWLHAVAIGYSPQYLEENEDGVYSNWPRIPLPNDAGQLCQSAELGKKIAALLNTEENVLRVTSGLIREELRTLGVQQGHDLAITARWGSVDSQGRVNPGAGDARERDYTPDELATIEQGAKSLGLELDDALALLGDTTFDLYLNDETWWSNVPANVYGYTIGGYQVIKKWLSYRNKDVIGRPLAGAESLEVTHMVRRIAAIIFLQPWLNANYREVAVSAY